MATSVSKSVYNNRSWHTRHPMTWVTANCTVSLDPNNYNRVYISGSVDFRLFTNAEGGYNESYGVPPYTGNARGMSAEVEVQGRNVLENSTYSLSRTSWKSVSLNCGPVDFTSGTIRIRLWCSWYKYHDCDGTSNPGYTILEFNWNELDRYKYPTIGCGTSYIISRYDTRREMWVDGNASGDNTDTDTWVNINGNRENWDIGNSGGTYGFYPNQKNVSDGSSYSFQAYRQHTQRRDWTVSTSITLYTYRTPRIDSFDLSNINFSGNGNTTLLWQTNGKRWGNNIGNYDGEKDFKTLLKFNSDNVWFESLNNQPAQVIDNGLYNQTQTLNKNIIDSHFNIDQRSKEKINTVLSIKRNNPSSNVDSGTLSKNISVQFWPKYRPDNDTNINNPPISLIYKENNANGKLISPAQIVYIDDIENVYVQWTYPDKADAGIVNGYTIRIYEDKHKTKLFKTFTINTNNLTSSRIFNIKTELKRGILNYISISAFYNKPDKTGKVEGPALDYAFILPLGKLHKPVISYPINNTQWHNTKFRILFELPEDSDYDTYSTDIKNNYLYRNIEVCINNTFTIAINNATEQMTPNAVIDQNAFSTMKLRHKTKICINPSLVQNFPINNSYSIKVRVQKNYYEPIWSEWSDTINITQKAISFSVNKGDLILAEHFNRMRNWSIQLYNVYPINKLSNQNIEVNKNEFILKDIYDVIYNTILGIQTEVNKWAVFDTNRSNVKFNQNIYELSGDNKVKVEVITALPNNASENGRNYIKLIVDCMNKLY